VVSRLYGAIPHDAEPNKGQVPLRRIWVVLDPMLRVLKVIPFATDGSDVQALETYLNSLPPPSRFAGFEVPAPVLILPNVFEPEFCAQLVSLYEQHGGAVVFSCSLLHAVAKMTRGRRYAFLPFLYDEEASKIREANNAFLSEGVDAYEHSGPAHIGHSHAMCATAQSRVVEPLAPTLCMPLLSP